MGYTTDFSGQLKITPALKPEHEAYLRAFANTRRMQRNAEKTKSLPDPVREAAGLPVGAEGGYYVGSPSNHGQDATPDVVDHNEPPAGQPGLWCQWTIGEHPPETAGDVLEWDGGEKFYSYVEWLEYLVQHFFQPWGYSLTGQIKWQGEDSEDVGCIDVRRNVVRSYQGSVVYPGLEPAVDAPAPAKAIDLTPTPGALKHLHTVFQAEAKQARKNAEAASNLADELEEANNNSDDYAGRPSLQRVVHVMDDQDITLVIQALHGFADAEHQRAEKLDAGAVECGGTLAERILARNESEFDCGCGNCTCCGLVKEAVAAGMRRDETPHQFVRRS